MQEKSYQPFEVDQHITAMSRYYAGRIGSKFFMALRDDKKILGIKCPKCGRVYWPPRQTCGPCFYNMSEADMLELGPGGVVVSFTKVEYDEPVIPRKAPFIYALIRLDGADTAMAHFIEIKEGVTMGIGLNVEAVFAEERKGNILDISHFRPVAG